MATKMAVLTRAHTKELKTTDAGSDNNPFSNVTMDPPQRRLPQWSIKFAHEDLSHRIMSSLHSWVCINHVAVHLSDLLGMVIETIFS